MRPCNFKSNIIFHQLNKVFSLSISIKKASTLLKTSSYVLALVLLTALPLYVPEILLKAHDFRNKILNAFDFLTLNSTFVAIFFSFGWEGCLLHLLVKIKILKDVLYVRAVLYRTWQCKCICYIRAKRHLHCRTRKISYFICIVIHFCL